MIAIRALLAIGLAATAWSRGTASPPPEPGALGAPASAAPVRVPFLGGAFVTYNRRLPIEVEQAAAGLPTDRPVLVWAGD